MMLDRELILKLAEKYESFYLYDGRTVLDSIAALGSSLEGVRFLYSAKANPHPSVLRCIFDEGFGLDAASMGEVSMGVKLGLAPEDIYYSAPGKSMNDLDAALEKCVIIADSAAELERIQYLAARHGVKAEAGVRINPNFTFDGEGGASCKFGIDEDEALKKLAEWDKLKNLHICGIHVHSRSQELDTQRLCDYYGRMFELAVRCQKTLGRQLHFVNMGSGIGIPYAATDSAVDLKKLGAHMNKLCKEYAAELPEARIFIETGRFVSGRAGVYVTHVNDVKTSLGKKYVILANTLNGFVRPSIAQMVERASDAAPCEPLYTGPDAFGFAPLTDETETETVTVCGNLCTGADVIAQDTELPKLKTGDVFVITNAGSYAAVLTPMQFASLTPPVQIFAAPDGRLTVL